MQGKEGRKKASRLILVVAAYFPDSYGGAERQAQILAEALGAEGVDVTLVAPTIDHSTPEVEETTFGRIVRKHLAAYPNFGGRQILSFLRWSLWFPRHFSRSRWQGVPVYVFHARLHAFGPLLAAVQNGSRLLVKLGGGGEASEFVALRSKRYVYGRLIERALKKRVDLFVSNSRAITGELREIGIPDTRILQIHNGVALPDKAVIEDAIARRGGSRFIYAGRLIPDKSIDVLFDAARLAGEDGLPVDLRLVGKGSEKDRFEPGLSMIRPPARVAFPGYVADIYSELLSSDYFLCASQREGQSNALLEAMSAGVIPVVFAASGVRDVVEHGVTGWVVETATPQAFLAAIRQVLAMPAGERRRMSLAARDFAERSIGITAVARTMLTVL